MTLRSRFHSRQFVVNICDWTIEKDVRDEGEWLVCVSSFFLSFFLTLSLSIFSVSGRRYCLFARGFRAFRGGMRVVEEGMCAYGLLGTVSYIGNVRLWIRKIA